eukprot:6120675-Prymnesium_polylepis.2
MPHIIGFEGNTEAPEHLELKWQRCLVHQAVCAPHDKELTAVLLYRQQRRSLARFAECRGDEAILIDDPINILHPGSREALVKLILQAERLHQCGSLLKEQSLHVLKN